MNINIGPRSWQRYFSVTSPNYTCNIIPCATVQSHVTDFPSTRSPVSSTIFVTFIVIKPGGRDPSPEFAIVIVVVTKLTKVLV